MALETSGGDAAGELEVGAHALAELGSLGACEEERRRRERRAQEESRHQQGLIGPGRGGAVMLAEEVGVAAAVERMAPGIEAVAGALVVEQAGVRRGARASPSGSRTGGERLPRRD